MNKVISVALFVVATAAVSSAVTCYVCVDCGDPFSSGAEVDCPTGVTTCSKVKGGIGNANAGITTCLKRKGGAGGASTVGRSCGGIGSPGCTKVGDIETCICEGEKCNSAGFAKVSLVALMATLAVPFVLLN